MGLERKNVYKNRQGCPARSIRRSSGSYVNSKPLKAKNSLQCKLFFLERLMGVEPTYAAWEAAVLPMNYSRVWVI